MGVLPLERRHIGGAVSLTAPQVRHFINELRQTMSPVTALVRLACRDEIKPAIRDVVVCAEEDPTVVIQPGVMEFVKEADRNNVQALVIEELSRLHVGVLGRHGLRPLSLQPGKIISLSEAVAEALVILDVG